ncbi:MAG: metallophosphoesterase [Nitrospirae bacterium]|nr:metallophosphoesterase [Nitrospirota bacterium]
MMKKNVYFIITALVLFTGLLLFVQGCGSGGSAEVQPVKSARFAVFSDPHLYDAKTLGDGGGDLAAYLSSDRKMLLESDEILTTVINDLKTRGLDFVMIPGDLTKDGELVNHLLMARRLSALRDAGIKVYVVPGNHDINNPRALSYRASPPAPVPGVSPDEFREIYNDFGYKEALFRDPASLSYIVEPVPGVWLFAIDSCEYEDNLRFSVSVTSGAIRASTRAWMIEKLRLAGERGKTVIGMMHHGVLEHFAGQASFFPQYLLENWQDESRELSDNGLNIVFTGHFHSQDVSKADFPDSTLYDIETGSLVTSPSPYRIVDLDVQNRGMVIDTLHVTTIPSHAADFEKFSRNFLKHGLTEIVEAELARPPYSVKEPLLSQVTPLLVAGMMAHTEGDEQPDGLTRTLFNGMLASNDEQIRTFGMALSSIWTDLAPGDNNLSVAIGSR